MGILLSILLGFIPMFFFAVIIYRLDRYEKEPKILLGAVFLWGAVVAAGGAFILNTILGLGVYLLTGSEGAADFSTGSLFAPIIEESLKGLAVLLIFFVARKEFDSVLDGIIYAAVAALGFAATENAYYIYSFGFDAKGMAGLWEVAFIRIILVGWQHPFYTAFIGIGLALARTNRSILIKLIAPVIGWFIAVLAHSFHNTVATFVPGFAGLAVGTFFDWTGWLIMLGFILWMVSRERRMILKYLWEEVQLGTITPAQYATASSSWGRNLAPLQGISSRRFDISRRFYQLCAELAHKKDQLTKLGEVTNTATIDSIRGELRQLSQLLV
jgi:RsiW-degrading membrane proteinase PrsW (M82 family)